MTFNSPVILLIGDNMKSKGFTLLELLIYIAIIAFVITAVSALLLWGIRMRAKAKITDEVSRQADRAMAIMLREVREAQSVYTPTSVFFASPGQLSLQSAKYVTAGEGVGYIDFFLCGSRLCLKKEGQNPVAFTSENVAIDELVFSPVGGSADPSAVRISLTLRYNSPAQQPAYTGSVTLQSSATIRSQE